MPGHPASDPRPEKRRRVSSLASSASSPASGARTDASADSRSGAVGPAAAAPSPPSVRPRNAGLRVSLQSPPSVPIPSPAENRSNLTRGSPVAQEPPVAAALRTGSGQTPRVNQAHTSRATIANTAIGSPRPVADSIPRASLSDLSGPAAVGSNEVLPATAAPQQGSGRRRGLHARTPTPTPPDLTRAESDSDESTSDMVTRAVQLRGREGSGRVNSHVVRTPAAPPSPSVQPTTPGGNAVVAVDNLRLAARPPDTHAASEDSAVRASVGPAALPDSELHNQPGRHPMAGPLGGGPPSQWDALSLSTLRDRLRNLALQREWVRPQAPLSPHRFACVSVAGCTLLHRVTEPSNSTAVAHRDALPRTVPGQPHAA